MKKFLLPILILSSFFASAQSWTPVNSRERFNAGLGIPVRPVTSFLDAKDSALIFINPADTQEIWWRYRGQAMRIGTTYQNQINVRVLYSDTAPMLSPYLRSNIAAATYVPLIRTVTINGITQDLSANRIWNIVAASDPLKLNISDTAGMLSPYLRTNIAAASFYPLVANPAGYLTAASIAGKLNISDTSAMLGAYLRANLAAATYVPLVRTLTINGVTQDLTVNRSWTVSTSDPLKLNISDTAAMLAPYLRSNLAAATYYLQTNPAGYITSASIAGKLNISDTAAMLLPYLRKIDTTAMLVPYLRSNIAAATYYLQTNPAGYITAAAIAGKLNISDTSAMLSVYLRSNIAAATYYLQTNPAGYITSASIAGKLNISDTAAMLLPYLRKIDTTAMLVPYLRSNIAAATYATIANLALKLNISDTASMLSPYLRLNLAAATYVPLVRTITINGTTQDLSVDRTFTVTGSRFGVEDATITQDRTVTQTNNDFFWNSNGSGIYRQRFSTGLNGDYVEFGNYGSVGLIKANGFDGTHYGVFAVDTTAVAFGQTEGKYTWENLNVTPDTSNYKPLVVNTSFPFDMKVSDGWKGGVTGNTIYTGDGTIPGDRLITMADSNAVFTLTNKSFNNDSLSFYFAGNASITKYNNGGNVNDFDRIQIGYDHVSISSVNTTTNHGGDFKIEGFAGVTGATYTDYDINATGIKYNSDYSATYVARSLIDKGYADATYAPAGSYIHPADTAAMLAPYLRVNVAAATYATISNLALKVNISDTASMLSPYLRNNVAAATYATITNLALKLNKSDTAAMLSPYLRTNIAAATYATITNLALKLNISDTASMLSPYLRSSLAAATYATITNLALKINISDSAAMLAPYLRVNVAAATYAPIVSPSLTGTPLSTTASAGTNTTQIATTAFVSTAISNAVAGVNPAVSVAAATTSALAANTYVNGVAGVGATITITTPAALVIDGYTVLLNDRVLIKNEGSPSHNGVYVVTTLGTGIIQAILTRASDYNQPSDINNSGAIPVINGTANAITQWVITTAVTTIGTDAINYTEFSVNPVTLAPLASPVFTGTVTIPSPFTLGATSVTATGAQLNLLTFTDVTTGNVSTSAHGFAPKAPNIATQYLDGTGAYSVPAGTTYTFSTGLTNASGTITADLSTGKSGGLTVTGGTAASENLTLQSTSNATKGLINFGSAATSFYSSADNYLKIRTDALGFTIPTATTQGILLSNATAATVSVPQSSPPYQYEAQGWRTTAGGSTAQVLWRSYINTTNGSANPTSAWNLQSNTAGNGWSSNFVINNSNTVTTGVWGASPITPAFGGTGIANNAASTITISGNFGTTFTVSGTTSVTLPTSGTLITGSSPTITTPVINGLATGTGVDANATASTIVTRDANGNINVNSTNHGYTTTATAAGTTTLTVGSTNLQYFTGTNTQTVLLPVTSTLVLGQRFIITNNSSGNVTVQSSGANTIQVLAPSTNITVTCILTSGTTETSWNAIYQNFDDPYVLAMQDLGSTVKAQSMGCPIMAASTATALTTGQAKWAAIRINKPTLITGIKVYMRQAGAYTATGYNGAALYSRSGTTATLIDNSTTNNTLWTATANTVLSIPLAATHTVQPGTYYVVLFYNQSAQTTAPQVNGCAALSQVNMATLDYANSAFSAGVHTSLTSATTPITLSAVNGSVAPFWCEVY